MLRLKKLLFNASVCCFFGFTTNIHAQCVLFSDDFESGGSEWILNQATGDYGPNQWIINNVWVESFYGQSPVAQPNTITNPNGNYLHIHDTQGNICMGNWCMIPPAMNAIFIADRPSMRSAEMTNSISTLGKTNVQFSYWFVCNGWPDWLYNDAEGRVYYSIDDGANWTYLATHSEKTSWEQATYTNPNFDNQATLKFKFFWHQPLLGYDPPFSIDDVVICVPTDGCECTPGDDSPQSNPTADIINVAPAKLEWCRQKEEFNVTFDASGTFNAGNQFIAEISNASGSFASPLQIGTLASTSTGTLTIPVTVPNTLADGTGYRIRVRSTDIVVTSPDNGTNIVIKPTPYILIPSMPTLCANSAVYTLSGFMPSSTTFTGIGITGNQFNPTVAGEGTHKIVCTSPPNEHGCPGIDTATIVVDPALNVSLMGPPTVCSAATSVPFITNMSGGTFSENGVQIDDFNPSEVDLGSHTITYTINDPTCGEVFDTHTILVQSSPSASFVDAPASVCLSGGVITLSGTPADGVFVGVGVSGNQFDPQVAGIGGPYTIQYIADDPDCGPLPPAVHQITVTSDSDAGVISIVGSSSNEICSTSLTTQLTSTVAGGTWTIDPTTVATINLTTGVVTPVQAGFATATYTLAGEGACAGGQKTYDIEIKDPITVGQIVGVDSICLGGATKFVLVNGSGTGMWSSGNDAYISVDENGNGTTTGAGSTKVIFTVSDAVCGDQIVEHPIVVSPPTDAGTIDGNLSICFNDPTVFSSSTPGGSWSSNPTTIATIDESGNITTHTQGQVDITYTVLGVGGCADASKTVHVLISDAPVPIWLEASSVVCQDATTTYSADIVGGTYSSDPSSIAQVDPNTGVVTGKEPGKTTITYTVTSTCTRTISKDITVIALPNAGAINGPSTVEVGSNVKFDNPAQTSPDMGVWTTDDPSIAFVDNEGNVTTIGVGTVVITYSVDGTCGKDSTKTTLIITDKPTATGDFKVPTAFSPDGDNIDDVFVIKGLENYPGSAIYIYNEWGSIVYQSNDYKNDWNGHCQNCMLKSGGLPTGTYYYVLELKTKGTTKNHTGYVYLER